MSAKSAKQNNTDGDFIDAIETRPQLTPKERAIVNRPEAAMGKRQAWEIEQLTNIVTGHVEGGADPCQAWAQVLRSDQLAQESEAPI